MKVFCIAYGGGHITMMAPVVRELEARGIECVVMALTTGYRKAIQLGLHPLGYRDFARLVSEPERVLQWGRELVGENSHPDVAEEESLWYLGVNFAQWVSEQGEVAARQRYAAMGRRSFYPVDFMTAVLRDVAPAIVLTTNTPRSEGAALEAASRLGIPSVSMVDLFLQPNDEFCRRKHHPDRITVIAPSVKGALVASGLSPDRIVVTGNPAFDTLRDPAVQRQAQELRQRWGWAGKRVILFAGHEEGVDPAIVPPRWRGQGFCTEVRQWLLQWIHAHPDDALLLRQHPSESHLYPALPAHPRLHISEPSSESLHPVLLAADVVIVQTSTVGLEGALSGKRVLCLTFAPSVRSAPYNYAALGLAEGVGSFEELAGALFAQRASNPPDHAMYCVGRAAGLVADQVMALGPPNPN